MPTKRGDLQVHLPDGAYVTASISDAEIVYPRPDTKIPFISRVDEMPFNETPNNPNFISRRWMSWPTLIEPTGITIHHTMSHSPLATAKYCTQQKGYPSIQYHFWISADDNCPAWQLVPLNWAIWHDHTGAHPTTFSIGMAGHLHQNVPPDEQINSAVKLVHWLMEEFSISLAEVQGHNDRAKSNNIYTICPGWNTTGWRQTFYDALGE